MPIEMLYLVMASSGLYDCHAKWVVCALRSLPEADAYCVLASAASEAAIAAYKQTDEGRDASYTYFRAPTKYDLAHEVNDTPVRYYVEPVPLCVADLPTTGLLGIADAYATAQGLARERNMPGLSQRLRKPVPVPAVEVTGDFAAKLKAAIAA